MNEEQIELLKKLGIVYDKSKELTDEQKIEIEDAVGDHLTLHCLDDRYRPNQEGLLCESILEIIDSL